jgi:hypothetical protein
MSIDPARTTPRGLARFADDYLAAALAADQTLGPTDPDGVASAPVLYLLGQSVELSLKAFLAHRGVSLEDLKSPKKFGHSLDRCLEKAQELGLPVHIELTELDVATIGTLNALYASKELNYIVTGFRHYPRFGAVRSVAVRILKAVAPAVDFPLRRFYTAA